MKNLQISFKKGDLKYILLLDNIEEKESPDKLFAELIAKTIVENNNLRVDLVIEHLKKLFGI